MNLEKQRDLVIGHRLSRSLDGGAVHVFTEKCKCVKLFDPPSDSEEANSIVDKKMTQVMIQFAPVNISMTGVRRIMPRYERKNMRRQISELDPNVQIKLKIKTLVEQAIHDTNRTVQIVRIFRNKIKKSYDYKIGFLISYIKRERELMNDFFELTLQFREHAELLQQMKVFEYIMRGNVNITTLVRQVIHLHIEKREGTTTTPTAQVSEHSLPTSTTPKEEEEEPPYELIPSPTLPPDIVEPETESMSTLPPPTTAESP